MKTLPSVEVQNEFGKIANLIKSGEFVTVTQYKTPTIMMLPYALAVDALRAYYAQELAQFMETMPPAKPDAPDLSIEAMNELIHDLRP